MAEEEAASQGCGESISDLSLSLSLSRSVSLSRLNAQAPEFVPSPRTSDLHQAMPMNPTPTPTPTPTPPPPPPQPLLHLYHSPPSFHLPIRPLLPNRPIINHPIKHHFHPHPHHHYYGAFADHDHPHPHPLKPASAPPSDHSKPNTSSTPKLSDDSSLKLLNQVEYYFSDLNLATTDHLMRFISKDPEGFVPISVVASFKKIKALINGHAHLATILRNSTKLLVSEDGKRVRRLHPITESDMEELQSRIIVAENLPEDHCHQNLMKVFSAVGSVKTIRTCPPQTPTGGASSASRSAKSDNMHYSNKLHAFVEYESVELAEKAVTELNDEGNWRSGLRVRLMVKRTSKASQGRGRKGNDGEATCEEEEEACTADQPSNGKQIEDAPQQPDAHLYEHLGEENVNEKEGGQKKGRNRGRGKGRGRSQYNRGNNVGGTTQSSSNNGMESSLNKQPPPGPRMPDGTRGFAMGRGKPVTVNTAA